MDIEARPRLVAAQLNLAESTIEKLDTTSDHIRQTLEALVVLALRRRTTRASARAAAAPWAAPPP